jgi:flagellin FlaB
MNLIRKGHGHKHRGVVGIESAIVLIAFVIVAAALAFVVLNMGFATSQKAKTAIVATLGEAGSSLSVSGKVFAWSDTAIPDVEVIGVPIKLASGGESVNLNQAFTAVKFISNSVTYDDVYAGVTTGGPEVSLDDALDQAVIDGYCTSNPIAGVDPAATCAFVYFTIDNNGNDIIDQGEHAVLAIAFATGDNPVPLEKVKMELIPPSGATMTVERQIPNLSSDYVDLG